MIEYLLKNADKFNIGVIDDREHHNRIEFHFSNEVLIKLNNDCAFYNVEAIIYFVEDKSITVTIDDEYTIGYILDINNIKFIKDKKLKIIYKR